jgi:hypothetical protein
LLPTVTNHVIPPRRRSLQRLTHHLVFLIHLGVVTLLVIVNSTARLSFLLCFPFLFLHPSAILVECFIFKVGEVNVCRAVVVATTPQASIAAIMVAAEEVGLVWRGVESWKRQEEAGEAQVAARPHQPAMLQLPNAILEAL